MNQHLPPLPTLRKRVGNFDGITPEEKPFELVSQFQAAGDQPQAITELDANLTLGIRCQTLLGVTGSGKTFTMANVIAKQNRPTLIIAPNKTLAAQLYSEFREFFPNNQVRFFISYYDYYQPEAYIPSTDTYIEKDSSINEEIDKLRHSATRAVLERRDTIVVASVSCIYGLGAPDEYFRMMLFLEKGQAISREHLILQLVTLQYERTDIEFVRGSFRVRGDIIDIFPSDEDSRAYRVTLFGDEIEEIALIDPLTGAHLAKVERCAIYPLSHFVTSQERLDDALVSIEKELWESLPQMKNAGKALEAQRLEQRTLYDLELLREVGFCPGIENYSRHLDGRVAGTSPATLLDYFPQDMLLIIDESHVTLSQLGGMYRGDRSRKQSLVDFGFRLPSALDNRPLNPDEFWERVGQTIFVSATPGEKELEICEGLVIEQVNRPTGLVDPQITIRPALNQVDDLLSETRACIEQGDRVLVTTLTKRMAEDLAQYFRESGIACRYLHSDINAVDRIDILRGLRRGDFDVLIGINLLREGLDLVEVSLVAILDADKEGFLRSTRSLIQTVGRAARNIRGRAILYADKMTDSMKSAIEEMDRRRAIQETYNTEHKIIPRSTTRAEQAPLSNLDETEGLPGLLEGMVIPKTEKEQQKLLEKLKKQMYEAAAKREFERAAALRDALTKLQEILLR